MEKTSIRKDLYYMTAGGRLMAVAVAPIGSEFVFEAAQGLFQTPVIPETWNHYDVARDGQQFLLNPPSNGRLLPRLLPLPTGPGNRDFPWLVNPTWAESHNCIPYIVHQEEGSSSNSDNSSKYGYLAYWAGNCYYANRGYGNYESFPGYDMHPDWSFARRRMCYEKVRAKYDRADSGKGRSGRRSNDPKLNSDPGHPDATEIS